MFISLAFEVHAVTLQQHFGLLIWGLLIGDHDNFSDAKAFLRLYLNIKVVDKTAIISLL